MRRSERHRKLKEAGKSEEEIKRIFKKKVPMTLFSWDGEIDTALSPSHFLSKILSVYC